MLPPTYPPGTSGGEAKMFELIRDAKDSDDLVCLHSLGIARHRRKDYAEADFIVIAPSGIYCLEVKGGDVERRDGVWTIGRGAKSYTSHEGPFKQAQSARWALIDYLDHRLGRRIRNELLVGWGVAFPDIYFDQTDPEWDPEVVYDVRDTGNSFAKYVERLEAYFKERATQTGRQPANQLSRSMRDQLVDALRGDFDLVPSLRGMLLETERELVSLSAEQHRVLDYALSEKNPRIICDGPAGAGKTLIALEAARRLASDGLTVLLICYNDNLSRFLRLDAWECAGVQVTTLHRFLVDVIKRGGFAAQLRGQEPELHRDFFDRAVPELFESACDALCQEDALPQYDALVIDEAQDVLTPAFLNCLDLVLSRGFKNGRWLIFEDSQMQSGLYGRMEEALIASLREFGAASFDLKENFRNPREVALEASAVSGAAEPICRRSLRSPVDYRKVTDEKDQAKALRALLVHLLKEGVPPATVSILSGRKLEECSVVKYAPDIGKPFRPVSNTEMPNDDAFTICTIAGFKGLENDIIILTDLPDRIDDERARAELYVGMTRARTKLYALVGEPFLKARATL
jgi:hypothetical protein